MKKSVFSVILSIAIIFTCAIPAQAAVGNTMRAEQIKIDNMTNAERNAYISEIAERAQSTRTAVISQTQLKLAWYAAAKIAEHKYPSAARIVQYAVWGIDYTETNGPISQVILRSPEYQQWAIKYSDDSLIFGSGDLYYALKKADIFLVSLSGAGSQVYVHDVFDFDLEILEGVFKTLINAWGWLSSQMGVLSPIEVDIYFTDGLIGTYSAE